jgi:hypothetical protein
MKVAKQDIGCKNQGHPKKIFQGRVGGIFLSERLNFPGVEARRGNILFYNILVHKRGTTCQNFPLKSFQNFKLSKILMFLKFQRGAKRTPLLTPHRKGTKGCTLFYVCLHSGTDFGD